MLDTISRRGPDGRGVFEKDNVSIGMTRLAIIDLESGDQPIFNESRTVAVVCNGEIYNSPKLRIELEKRGHIFRTRSDVEVIVHLYEEYGEDTAAQLDGMFAFALYDTERKITLIARDRLGIKPLFLARNDKTLSFCSEIKGLLVDKSIQKSIDHAALEDFLTYTYIPAPRTIYKNISKMLPGHYAVIEDDCAIRQVRYWQAKSTATVDCSVAETARTVDAQLRQSVGSHLLSDVPVGVFLSGGLDSSLVAAYAAQQSERPIKSFTVGFQDSGSGFVDERALARDLARQYKFEHHEISVSPSLPDIIDELTSAFDEPFADDSMIPTYYLCKAAGQRVKVVLSGLGGDELFGGYRRHLGLKLGESYGKIPSLLRRRILAPLVQSLPDSAESSHLIDHMKRFVRADGKPFAERYQDSLASITSAELESLLTHSPRNGHRPKDLILERMDGTPDLINSALKVDLETFLVDDILALNDRLSMWHSLEVRVPFLDHRLVELALNIPQATKIRGWTQKYVMRLVAQKYLPKTIISHKKQGFEAPMARWLRGPLRSMVESVLSHENLGRHGLFDSTVVSDLVEAHMSRTSQNSKIIFSLLMFETWFENAMRSA